MSILILEDGTQYHGKSFGANTSSDGEVVFNTGMVGYPETLTDPSYSGQILTFTFPLIGNYGVPSKEYLNGLLRHFESDKIQVRGVIVGNYSEHYSHWNAKCSLHNWLQDENIPGITGIDTRKLTRRLREKGTMLGKILHEGNSDSNNTDNIHDPNEDNLASLVSIKEPIEYAAGEKKIILVDCGVKNNIIRAFLGRNITVLRVPHDFDYLNIEADGVFISNGPGDPKKCTAAIETTKKCMQRGKPILGICLGSQILALAAGANTFKLKYGHRSHNQPVNEYGTRRCFITSQNHGYAVDGDSLPLDWREWFNNDNDGTNEGIIHISKPFFGTQFHPEASPGPDDTEFIFDMFVRSLG
jgi:carbamoyl-phosphate synthase small subunit